MAHGPRQPAGSAPRKKVENAGAELVRSSITRHPPRRASGRDILPIIIGGVQSFDVLGEVDANHAQAS